MRSSSIGSSRWRWKARSVRPALSTLAVARCSEIALGHTKAVNVDGVDILLCNVDGTFLAIEDVCTHDGSPLDQGRVDGACITCPRHGARFDLRTGAALTLPAILPVQTYPVRLDGDKIFLDL